MALTENQNGRILLSQGIKTEISLKSGETVSCGDLVGYNGGWMRATAGASNIAPRYIACSGGTGPQKIYVTTEAVVDNLSGMTSGQDIYLSDTPGQYSGSPGTNTYIVGRAVSDKRMFISLSEGGTVDPNDIVLASGNVLVGSGSGKASAVTPSGDLTISNAGVTALDSKAVYYAIKRSTATSKWMPLFIGSGGGFSSGSGAYGAGATTAFYTGTTTNSAAWFILGGGVSHVLMAGARGIDYSKKFRILIFSGPTTDQAETVLKFIRLQFAGLDDVDTSHPGIELVYCNGTFTIRACKSGGSSVLSATWNGGANSAHSRVFELVHDPSVGLKFYHGSTPDTLTERASISATSDYPTTAVDASISQGIIRSGGSDTDNRFMEVLRPIWVCVEG